MATLRRIADSCLTVTTDNGTTLIDPGFFSWESDAIDLDSLAALGEVHRVLVTHAHADHVHPAFVRWLVDRGTDVVVHGNDEVAATLSSHDIVVDDDAAPGTSFEDGRHERIPTGETPPNRAWTVDGILTHPGDSYDPVATAPVLGLPLLTPWGSMTSSIEFATRMSPELVVPIHDFYLTAAGRDFAAGLATRALAGTGVDVLRLGWGQSATV